MIVESNALVPLSFLNFMCEFIYRKTTIFTVEENIVNEYIKFKIHIGPALNSKRGHVPSNGTHIS